MKSLQVLESVQSQVEKIKSDETQRFSEAASAGDGFRQGDLYIWKLDEIPADTAKTEAVLQLAIGSTQGARHILDSSDGVTFYTRNNANALQGPILNLAQERVLTHPEHGDVILPAGCYEVTYQRQFAEELRRVKD